MNYCIGSKRVKYLKNILWGKIICLDIDFQSISENLYLGFEFFDLYLIVSDIGIFET